jgi:hypothetical protein
MSHRSAGIPAVHSDDAQFAALIPEGTSPFPGGSTRTVYPIPGHQDLVLKVAKNGSNAANWVEAVIYWHLTDNSQFGEVVSISESGKYLVMERLDDLPADGAATQKIPTWWTDRKRENFGRSTSTGAIKIRDYAQVNLSPGNLTPMPSASENAEMAKWIGLVR